jgi:hypothetical protein
MRKLMLALVAGCMSAAIATAYAASGSPADTDKAGRAGPGTTAGEQGAAKPGGTAGTAGMAGSSTTGAASGASAAGTAGGTSGGAGMSTGTDDTKSQRGRRAARAPKG